MPRRETASPTSPTPGGVPRAARPVPSLHHYMMIASVALEMFLAVLWFCAPPEKARFLEVLLPMPMAFLFGKFTNGFGGRGNGQGSTEHGGEEDVSPSPPLSPSPDRPAPDPQLPMRTTLRADLLCLGLLLLAGGCAGLWSGSRGLPSPPPPDPVDRAPGENGVFAVEPPVTVTAAGDRDEEAARQTAAKPDESSPRLLVQGVCERSQNIVLARFWPGRQITQFRDGGLSASGAGSMQPEQSSGRATPSLFAISGQPELCSGCGDHYEANPALY